MKELYRVMELQRFYYERLSDIKTFAEIFVSNENSDLFPDLKSAMFSMNQEIYNTLSKIEISKMTKIKK